MTYEKAIKHTRMFLDIYDLFNDDEIAIETLIEATEKQIPKKLATNGENFGGMPYRFCPSCGHCMGLKPNASYCSECGQAIDCEVE